MRGKKGEELPYKVFTHLGKEKYEELLTMLTSSHCRTMSALLRDILTNKKITIRTRDETLDKVMEQLSAIRKELHAVGININQITRQFNIYSDFEHRMFFATGAAEKYEKVGAKVDELLVLIAKLSQKWLPE